MSELAQRTENDVHAIAEEAGLVAFLPQDRELFLDLDKDCPEPNQNLLRRLEVGIEISEDQDIGLIDNLLDIRMVSKFLTKSKGGNQHMYIKLNKGIKNPLAAVAIQAALGSDPVKEFLSIQRIMIGSEASVALFETPVEGARVTAWRLRVKSL